MTFWNYSIGDAGGHPPFSAPSMIPVDGTISWAGMTAPFAEAILDRIKHDAYKINIIPTDPANYRSMREVYGLDPALSE
jgi:hypothetical protein